MSKVSTRAGIPFGIVLLIESASFFAAAFVHRSMVPATYARLEELFIGSMLALGAVWSWFSPDHARSIGFRAQSMAMLATSLGLLALAVARSGRWYTQDLLFNAGVLLLLNLGLVIVSRRQ